MCFTLISTYQGIIASSTGLQLHEKAPLDLIAGVSAGIGVQWMQLTFCCTQCMVQFYPEIDLAEYKSPKAIKANYKSYFMWMVEILYQNTSVLIYGMGCMYWFILIFNARHHAFWNTQTLCLTYNLMYCLFLYQTGESLSLRNVPELFLTHDLSTTLKPEQNDHYQCRQHFQMYFPWEEILLLWFTIC